MNKQKIKPLKKKKERVYNIGLEEEEQKPNTRTDLEKRIMDFMKHHIGKDNATTPRELFTEVWGISPYDVEVYRRVYMWTTLKRICSELRRKNKLMVIIRAFDVYVLKTMDEYFSFERNCNAKIECLKQSKRKAYEWVRLRKWTKL